MTKPQYERAKDKSAISLTMKASEFKEELVKTKVKKKTQDSKKKNMTKIRIPNRV